jgi:hypothetical protein
MSASAMPQLRKCACGRTPAFQSRRDGSTRILQLKCACGNLGATLMYTKPEDEARMQQAAIDGWNLAG